MEDLGYRNSKAAIRASSFSIFTTHLDHLYMTLMFISLIYYGTTVLSLGLLENPALGNSCILSCWAFWESSLASLLYTFLDIIMGDLAFLNGFSDQVRLLVQYQHGLIHHSEI